MPSKPGNSLIHVAEIFRYGRPMLNGKFVGTYPFPVGSKPSKRTPHEHHWVSENTAGQLEFERWTCAWCGQKRIRLTAADNPELVRDWLHAEAIGSGSGR